MTNNNNCRPSALRLSAMCISHSGIIREKQVLELGCGKLMQYCSCRPHYKHVLIQCTHNLWVRSLYRPSSVNSFSLLSFFLSSLFFFASHFKILHTSTCTFFHCVSPSLSFKKIFMYIYILWGIFWYWWESAQHRPGSSRYGVCKAWCWKGSADRLR